MNLTLLKSLKSPKISVLVTLLFLLLWFLSGLFQNSSSTKVSEPSEKALTKVTIMKSVAQNHQAFLKVQGFTEADRRLVLRAETKGTVTELPGRRGEAFERGDILIRLSLDERGERLKEARALVEQRQLEFKGAEILAKKEFRSRTRLADARAKLEAAQADLARIRREISETSIKAPFKGVLDRRSLEVGDSIQVGDELATFVDLNPLLVIVYVPEAIVTRLKMGDPAMIEIQDKSRCQGELSFVGSIAEPNTRTFKVEVRFQNADHKVLDGMTAEVTLSLGVENAHYVSPAILSLNDQGLIGVKAVDDKSQVHFHPAKVINHNANGIWLGNLPEALNLIARGQGFVTAGEKVQVELKKTNEGPGRDDAISSKTQRGQIEKSGNGAF